MFYTTQAIDAVLLPPAGGAIATITAVKSSLLGKVVVADPVVPAEACEM